MAEAKFKVQPKFKVGDEVVLVGKYPDGHGEVNFSDGTLVVGDKYTIGHFYRSEGLDWCPSGKKYSLSGTGTCVDETMLVLANEYNKEQQFDLTNKKINVAAYAEQYNITLEQANIEIQTWLFEQGCEWSAFGKLVRDERPNFLFITTSLKIEWGKQGETFDESDEVEITLSRKIILTLSVVQDTIEFDGKTYNKDSFLKAIGQLEEIKGE